MVKEKAFKDVWMEIAAKAPKREGDEHIRSSILGKGLDKWLIIMDKSFMRTVFVMRTLNNKIIGISERDGSLTRNGTTSCKE